MNFPKEQSTSPSQADVRTVMEFLEHEARLLDERRFEEIEERLRRHMAAIDKGSSKGAWSKRQIGQSGRCQM